MNFVCPHSSINPSLSSPSAHLHTRKTALRQERKCEEERGGEGGSRRWQTLGSKSISGTQATLTPESAICLGPEKTHEQTSPQRIINASYIFVKLMKTTEISIFLLLGEETDTTEGKIMCLKSPSTASWYSTPDTHQPEQNLLITQFLVLATKWTSKCQPQHLKHCVSVPPGRKTECKNKRCVRPADPETATPTVPGMMDTYTGRLWQAWVIFNDNFLCFLQVLFSS